MLVGLCRWIHPASGHRCVLSLVVISREPHDFVKIAYQWTEMGENCILRNSSDRVSLYFLNVKLIKS